MSIQWNIEAEKLLSFLAAHQRILVSGHQNGDGDSVGSTLAMGLALEQLGCLVSMIHPDPVPRRYRFIDAGQRIEGWSGDPIADRADAVVVVDANDLGRLGELGRAIKQSGLPVLFVDHHPATAELCAEHIIHSSASSAGQVVFELLSSVDCRLEPPIARAITAAILYDTNSFRFVRNDATPLRIVASLLPHGVDLDRIQRALFSSKTPGKLRLMERMLSRMTLTLGERLAWSTLSQAEVDGFGCCNDDLRELVNLLVDIEGVEAAFLLKSEGQERCKLSFRSNGPIAVNQIAATFGGGGHVHAAGAMCRGSADEVIPRVLAGFSEVFGVEDR